MPTTTIEVPADEATLRLAEKAAAARHTTVPDMLSSMVESISTLDFDESKLSPITRQALGLARGIPDRPYRELLVEALMAKYGVDE